LAWTDNDICERVGHIRSHPCGSCNNTRLLDQSGFGSSSGASAPLALDAGQATPRRWHRPRRTVRRARDRAPKAMLQATLRVRPFRPTRARLARGWTRAPRGPTTGAPPHHRMTRHLSRMLPLRRMLRPRTTRARRRSTLGPATQAARATAVSTRARPRSASIPSLTVLSRAASTAA
jgi:hypothetical protein